MKKTGMLKKCLVLLLCFCMMAGSFTFASAAASYDGVGTEGESYASQPADGEQPVPDGGDSGSTENADNTGNTGNTGDNSAGTGTGNTGGDTGDNTGSGEQSGEEPATGEQTETKTDVSAAPETEDNWKSSVSGAALTDDWREDIAAVAATQVGYTETTYNGARWSRYGAWYGSASAEDWNALFVDFCLNYAGIPADGFPRAADCASLVSALASEDFELYVSADELSDYSTAKGDVVFFTYGGALRAGIVSAVSDESLSVIAGGIDGAVKTLPLSLSEISGVGSMTYAMQRAGLLSAEYDTDAADVTETLQDAIDAADDGAATTIYLDDYATDGSLVLDKTLTIPENKIITLTTKDGSSGVTVAMDASAEAADRVNMLVVDGGQVTLAGNVTWDFSNVLNSTTKIGSSIAYPHGIYTDNGSITIQNGNFQNFQASGNNIGAIYITGQNASLRMTGGTISNTKLTKTQWSAPVVVSRGASFVMEAGTICNNYTDGTGTVNGYQNSAGVLVISDYQMEADDGTDPSVLASKYKDTSFVMYGGKISGNETHYQSGGYDMGCGSGVYVHSYNNAYKLNAAQQAWLNENVEASFTMYGGEISGNTAFYGGGIVIDAPRSGQGGYGTAAGYLYGGSIINNTATRSGGAIFVGVDQTDNSRSYLYMTNVLITNNTAQAGGGLRYCSIGTTKVNVTNGGAIYGNTASVMADDLRSEKKTTSTASITLSERMLGGGSNNWYNDTNSKRYSSGTASKITADITGVTAAISLKNAVAAESGETDAVKLAAAKAKLLISGNTSAYYGGAIACNGTLIIGEEGEKTLNVTKEWAEGTTKQEVTVCLVATYNGTDYTLESITLNEGNSWQGSFTGLPMDADLVFSVKEVTQTGYVASYSEKTVSEDGKTESITITNAPETTEVTVTKSWDDNNNQDGKRPSSITVTLVKNGTPTEQTVTLTSADNWAAKKFENLPKSENGTEISYTVSETVPEGYTAAVTGDMATGYTVTNTRTPETTEVTVTKSWDDNNNQDGKRPDSITVTLVKNGTATEQTVTLTSADNWAAKKFENLPKSENGTEISYTVSETVPEGYTASYSGTNGAAITNTHTPGKVSVPVIKNWQDSGNLDKIRPNAVTIRLLADGKDTGLSLALSADCNWSGCFTNLDEYQNGQKIVYTVEENWIFGYSRVITGDMTTGFVVTNSHTPFFVPKTGDDSNIALWAALAGLSAAVLVGAWIIGRRKKRGDRTDK